MENLKRLLKPLVRLSRRTIEAKSGILMAQAVCGARKGESCDGKLAPPVSKVGGVRAGFPLSQSAFEKRVEQGNELYELVIDNTPVSYGWVAGGGARVGVLHNIELTVPDQAIYVWDCATAPAFRGHGHFQSLLKAILAAHVSGTTALVAVDSKNDASRTALRKAGFRPMFSYFSIRIFGYVIFSAVVEAGELKKAQPRFDVLTAQMNQA
ncbi:Acetyltransferase (GNAT) family protein [Marinobacter sp. es.042]|uniref:GNAT family N-acetyltransferase n=1 Tax=Marinobacter sp. es.042 TaxID=1761794 RepID=UPI000B5E9092|nr:GNAT family N-acetyltransferase [Marinobacter sp. es.042]SNB55515.1 Acetyltransferase (GNAT) family protein [Marinobacter sp. es.042]